MAYDKGLAQRVEEYLELYDDVYPKNMFGGIAWMVNGNIACGIFEESLISRVGPLEYKTALRQDGIHEFDITGRPMKGWIMADADAVSEDSELKGWIDKGLKFGRSLPAKSL